MKKIFAVLFGGIVMATINMAQAIEINISVTEINQKRGGNIIVMIFSKKGFPKTHNDALVTLTKLANTHTLEFRYMLNTEHKELAVKILHDENGDGKVTKNWTGIFPKEGLGFSNGQKISMTGPPNFTKSKLPQEKLKEGIKIPVRYP